MNLTHEFIAKRAAQELQDGETLNLGKGIPSLVNQFIPPGIEVMLLEEEGQLAFFRPLVSVGEDLPNPERSDGVLSRTVSSCFFSVDEASVMIRGGHLDLAIMDADEVDESGNLANWMVPGRKVQGVNGLMDLAVGAKRVILAMEHKTMDQKPKIQRNCRLPLTALGVVKRIITEMAVLDVTSDGLLLREIAPGLSVDEVTRSTEAEIRVDKDLKIIQV